MKSYMQRFMLIFSRKTCKIKQIKGGKMRALKMTYIFILAVTLGSCSSQSIKDEHVSTGGKVHDFSLPDQNGTIITLADILKNHKGAVIAFYPKDESKN